MTGQARDELNAVIRNELTGCWSACVEGIGRGYSIPAADPQRAGRASRIMRAVQRYAATHADADLRAAIARQAGDWDLSRQGAELHRDAAAAGSGDRARWQVRADMYASHADALRQMTGGTG